MNKLKYALSIVLAAVTLPTVFASEPDEIDEDSEISCAAKYHTYQRGYILSAGGSTTNGTIVVTLAQRMKNGPASISMEVRYFGNNRRDSLFGRVKMPDSVKLLEANSGTNIAFVTITKQATIGTYRGQRIVAAVSGIDPVHYKLNVVESLCGYRTAILSTGDLHIPLSFNIKKNGRLVATGYLPSGRRFSKSATLMQIGDDVVVPLEVANRSSAGVETLRLSLCVSGRDLSATVLEGVYLSNGSSRPYPLELVEFRSPTESKSAVKAYTVQLDGVEAQSVKIATFNEKTGLAKGKFVMFDPDARGRLKRKNGTLAGYVANGVVYGVASVRNIMAMPFTASARK